MPYDFARQAAVEQALVRYLGLPGRTERTKSKSTEFLAMWDAARAHEMAVRRAQAEPPPKPPEEPSPEPDDEEEEDDETPLTTASTPPAA